MGVDGYLVAELVTAFVFAVHDDVHGLAPRRIQSSETFADLEGQAVAHQGLVAVVVDKCPFLSLGGTFLG